MMKGFFSFVEIRTKVTSIFVFAMVICYLLATGGTLNWGLTLLFFGGMFLFDMATTAINNYIDSRIEKVALPFSRKSAGRIIFILIAASIFLGIWLVTQTDIIVLLAGIFCFGCGILYTYGPLPLSRLPLGEAFSGILYGLVIPFILLYVNRPSEMISYSFSHNGPYITFHLLPLFFLVLLCIPPICATANIMLANNICDMEKDADSGRKTLPLVIGKTRAMHLFTWLYIASYISVILFVWSGGIPPLYLIALVSAIPVFINVKRFWAKQEKQSTFGLSVQNYMVMIGGSIVVLVLIFILSKIQEGLL